MKDAAANSRGVNDSHKRLGGVTKYSQSNHNQSHTDFNGERAGGSATRVTRDSAANAVRNKAVAQTEEKPRNMEFPLDLVLPVFNLSSKKESSFIPTLKAKQKDLVGGKDKKGIFRGSTVH